MTAGGITPTDGPDLMLWALAYARHGLRVFPCYSVDHYGCRCNRSPCDRPGKHPVTNHGFHEATTDEAQIRLWWSYWPWANIGLVTGGDKIVVDFDRADDPTWPHEVRALLSAKTWIARSGRPGGVGRHVWLRKPADVKIKCESEKHWPGIDVRSDGGYVIAPPSSHVSGNTYEWIQDLTHELAEIPGEICSALAVQTSEADDVGGMTFPGDGPAWYRMSDQEAAEIRSALAVLDAAPRDQWLRMGMALKSTGAGEQAFQLWLEWSATATGKFQGEQDCRQTWLSIREYVGQGRSVTISSLFHEAREIGWRPAPASEATSSTTPAGAESSPPSATSGIEDLWTADVREPDWLIEDLVARGDQVMLFGPSSSGKTFIALDICARISHGLRIWGAETVPTHVLYVTGEGGAGLRNRVKGWQMGHADLAADAIGQRRRFDRVDMPDLSQEEGFLKLYGAFLEAQTAGRPYGLAVIDTLSWALGGLDENKASDVGQIYTRLKRLRTEFGAAVLIVHHSGKAAKGAGNGMEYARGSSVIGNNADAVLQVSKRGELINVYVAKVKEAESGQTYENEFVPLELGRTAKGKPIRTAFLRQAAQAGAERAPEPACGTDDELAAWMRHLVGLHRAGTSEWSTRELRAARPAGLSERKVKAMLSVAIKAGWVSVTTSTATGHGARPTQIHRLTERTLAAFSIAETALKTSVHQFTPDRIGGRIGGHELVDVHQSAGSELVDGQAYNLEGEA